MRNSKSKDNNLAKTYEQQKKTETYKEKGAYLKSAVAIINVIRHTQLSKEGLLQACLHVPSYEVHVRVVRILQPILDEAVNFVEAHVYILVLLIL